MQKKMLGSWDTPLVWFHIVTRNSTAFSLYDTRGRYCTGCVMKEGDRRAPVLAQEKDFDPCISQPQTHWVPEVLKTHVLSQMQSNGSSPSRKGPPSFHLCQMKRRHARQGQDLINSPATL